MVVTLEPDLEAALIDVARKKRVAPEVLALQTLRERFLASASVAPPRDQWERRLRSAATDCGVSLSNEAAGGEGLYD